MHVIGGTAGMINVAQGTRFDWWQMERTATQPARGQESMEQHVD